MPHPVPPFRHRLPADVAAAIRATAAGHRCRASLPVLVRTRPHEFC